MGWKIHKHVQPSGRTVHKLAYYHKRTKTLHVLKGSRYNLQKTSSLRAQKQCRNIDHIHRPVMYAVSQRLTPELDALNIVRVIMHAELKSAVRLYRLSHSYIKHTMYLPDGQVIPPPPLSYAVVQRHDDSRLAWKTPTKHYK